MWELLLTWQNWFLYVLVAACILLVLVILLAAFTQGAYTKPADPGDKGDDEEI